MVWVKTLPIFASRVCAGSPLHFARAAGGLRFHYGNTRAIHLHIEDGYGLAHHEGQMQLQGALNFPLLARADIGSDGFRRALHGFGRYLEAG